VQSAGGEREEFRNAGITIRPCLLVAKIWTVFFSFSLLGNSSRLFVFSCFFSLRSGERERERERERSNGIIGLLISRVFFWGDLGVVWW
jgi:hypothetical protein